MKRKAISFILIALILVLNTVCYAAADDITSYEELFGKDEIIDIYIDISESDLQDMYAYPKNEEYHRADITVNGILYGGKFEETYNRITSQIDELVKNDPNSMYTYEEYIKGIEVLHNVVMLRSESIKGQLDGTIPATAQGQKEDSSNLVDASELNLKDLGQFRMGGFGGR